jgi:hypothetical protein
MNDAKRAAKTIPERRGPLAEELKVDVPSACKSVVTSQEEVHCYKIEASSLDQNKEAQWDPLRFNSSLISQRAS